MGGVHNIPAKADEEGIVEPHLLPQRLLSLDGSALAQDHHNRIARCELHDGENDEYDAYDYGDHHQ